MKLYEEKIREDEDLKSIKAGKGNAKLSLCMCDVILDLENCSRCHMQSVSTN